VPVSKTDRAIVTVERVEYPAGEAARRTLDAGQEKVRAIVNGLFPSGEPTDGRQLIKLARQLQRDGRPDVLVGKMDKEGRTAVLVHMFVGHIIFTRKFIVDKQGRTIYSLLSGCSLLPDPNARKAEDLSERPVITAFEYDDKGRVTRRLTNETGMDWMRQGSPTEEIDEYRYTYLSPLKVAKSKPYQPRNVIRRITSTAPEVPDIVYDFDFARDILHAMSIDTNHVNTIQGQYARDIWEDPAARAAPQPGARFTRKFSPSFNAPNWLVIQMEVVRNAEGQLQARPRPGVLPRWEPIQDSERPVATY
jgi:hypothetical protein